MFLENRAEMMFIYDVIRANPNGDPDDGNRPRMDEQGYNLVTDVRLKRTIRDYWLSQNDENTKVLIRQQLKDDQKKVKSMADLVKDELGVKDEKKITREQILEELPKKFIDVRSFGAAVTLKDANVSITGPVQFGIGKSLNKPQTETMGITTVLSATGQQGAGTMGQFHYVDYSLILFHGIACEYNSQETEFSQDDLHHVYDGLWNGTKKLNTRSKFNHNPRLLFSVVSKEKEFQIGGLDSKIQLVNEVNIKSVKEAIIDVNQLLEVLIKHKANILRIEFRESNDLTYTYDGKEETSFEKILEQTGISLKKI